MVDIYLARHGQDADNAAGVLNGRRDMPLTDLGRRQAEEVALKMSRAGFALALLPTTTTKTTTTMKSKSAADASSSDAAAADASSPSSKRLGTIYSSPLRRARETADIFARVLSSGGGGNDGASEVDEVEVKILDDLIERDFGIMTGRPASSIVEVCGVDRVLATEKINYFLDPEGAETFPDLLDRARRLLSQIETITTASSDGDDDGDYDSTSMSSILLVTHGDFGKMLYAAYYDLNWEEVLRQFHFGNSEVLLLSRGSAPESAHVFETMQFNA